MELTKKDLKHINVFLYGWKGLANYYGVCIRTLQRWHRDLPIRWERVGHNVRLHALVADAYLEVIEKTKKK